MPRVINVQVWYLPDTGSSAPGTVIPFFAFPPAVRRVIYTTNAIESVHDHLRKIIKTRGHFPSDDAATKLIWLALRNITADWKRAAHQESEAGRAANGASHKKNRTDPAGASGGVLFQQVSDIRERLVRHR